MSVFSRAVAIILTRFIAYVDLPEPGRPVITWMVAGVLMACPR